LEGSASPTRSRIGRTTLRRPGGSASNCFRRPAADSAAPQTGAPWRTRPNGHCDCLAQSRGSGTATQQSKFGDAAAEFPLRAPLRLHGRSPEPLGPPERRERSRRPWFT
jgi:hypothetical protein